jgi:hypothetical protein
VDRALLIVHGAGDHEPITSLDEILNPTLNRLRYEGNLVSTRRFAVGEPAQPGGRYEGLVVEYVYTTTRCDPDPNQRDRRTPLMPAEFMQQTRDPQRLLVLEGRWDKTFLDPGHKEVSSWAGQHVGRMMLELLLYHLRNPVDVVATVLILAAFGIGARWSADGTFPWAIGDRFGDADQWVFMVLIIMGLIALSAALLDAMASWAGRGSADSLKCAPEDLTDATATKTNWIWHTLVPAVCLSVYQIQRAFVIIVAACATVFLTLLAPVVRVLSTVPGLNWASRNTIAALENFALAGAPTDVESISNNPVASAAIQTRLRGALAEVESRLRPNGELTIVAHSAAAPLAYWLLSEPGIHARQEHKRLRYRLITVGGALNWAKRGMDCEATPLDRPLVNSEALDVYRTYWLDVNSTWDPTPHGPVRRKEYEGNWMSWPQRERPSASGPRPNLLYRIARSLQRNWWRGRLQDRDGIFRPDPNMLVRNLGSPISAEHSEYFRNQQEFVPALVHAIDPAIEWAAIEAQPARKNQWANARLALLSGLVRGRMAVFIVPLAAFVGVFLSENNLITSCNGENDVADYRSDNSLWLLRQIGDGMSYLFQHLPVLGDQRVGVCNNVVLEQLALVVVIALICYALVDVYTNFCWATLGRRIEPLDSFERRARQPDDSLGWKDRWIRRLQSPSRWQAWRIPLVQLLLVWLPTLAAPLLFLFVFPISEYWLTFGLLVGVNVAMAPVEVAWFSRCIRMAPEAGIAYGRAFNVQDAIRPPDDTQGHGGR